MRDERSYYRKLHKKSANYRVNLPVKQWFDMHHQHFDWHGKGNQGHVTRVAHLNAHLRALRRARRELEQQAQPYQLFGYIDLAESQNNAVFIHTPNPNSTPFPAELGCLPQEVVAPPILRCRVDAQYYQIFKAAERGSRVYFLVPRRGEA